MKKLFSLILMIAILSANLCAIAADETADPAGTATGSMNDAYAILDVKYVPANDESAAHFLVHANTVEACSVMIILRDENTDAILFDLMGELPENMHNDSAKIGEELAFDVPENCILEALLIRSSNFTLIGEPYRSSEYIYIAQYAQTQTYSKTISDFPGKQVVSYDDANYAVLGDHVICASGAASANGGYTLAYDGSFSAGDVLMLDINGEDTPVKVASAQANGDGTITVQADDSIVLSDVYDYLQISSYLTPVGAASDDNGKIKTTVFKPSFETGPLSLEGEINFAVMIDAVYDKEARYFSMECWVENEGSVEVTLGGEFDTTDMDSPIEIPFSTIGFKVPKLDVEALLEVSLPLDIKVEAGGSTSIKFNSKVGFKYNSIDNEFVEINEDSSEAIAKIKGDVTVTAGPRIRLSAELFDFIDAEISGQVGIKGEGKLTGLEYGGKVTNFDEDKIHACDCCLDFDVFFFAGIYAKIQSSILEKLDVNLYDGSLIEATSDKIGDAYCSFVNEKESPYGGELSADIGECINCKYRAEISTIDYADRSVTGIPLSVTGAYGTVQNGVSPCTLYLYPGANTFTAVFENSTTTTTKTMPGKPASLVIPEDEVEITITVRDNDTQEIISGAAVTITLPDGSVRSAVTDASGQCFFDKLPQGEYAEAASADNYEPKTIRRLNFSAGQRVSGSISLEPLETIEVIVINTPEYEFGSNIDSTVIKSRVYIPQYPDAEAAVNARLAEVYAKAQSITASLKTNPVDSNGNKNLFSLKVGDIYVRGSWLFMSLSEMQYTSGAARPISGSYMLIFDARTGSEVETSDIVPEDADARDALVGLIEKHLRNDHGSVIYTDPATAAEYALTTTWTTWSIETDGLHITYSAEQIAPRYAGPLEIVLPYSELKGIIRDEFIPSDDTSSRATLSMPYIEKTVYDEEFEVYSEEGETLYALTVDGFIHELWVDKPNSESMNNRSVYAYNVSDAIIELGERVQGIVSIAYVDGEGEHKVNFGKGSSINIESSAEAYVPVVTPIS